MIAERIWNLLFPPKCILCQKILSKEETDLCHECRADTEAFSKANVKISFVAGWTALWYYIGSVRQSMLRYKFSGRRSYGAVYGRLLAMKLYKKPICQYDVLTWVPVSAKRRRKRGYDQVELLAEVVGRELGMEPVSTLQKVRNNRPQSGISGAAKRRANVLGAYRIPDPNLVSQKRVLLLDDIVTTGATAGECARILLTAGAKEVHLGCIAAAHHRK
jgi:ComF family protein